MKKIIQILLTFIFIFFYQEVLKAEDLSTFNGYNLGDDKTSIDKLGKPDQKQTYDKNIEAYVYYTKDKTGYFVIGVDEYNKIYKIQVTGKKPFNNEELKGLQLGDPEEKLYKIFGKPSESKYQDEKWGTSHFYDNGNYSFETNNGIVTSIYIMMTNFIAIQKILKQEFSKPENQSKEAQLKYLFPLAMHMKNKENDCATAIKIFDLILNLDPNILAATVNQANCYLFNNQFEKALIQYQKVEKEYSNNSILMHNIGLANYRLKEYNKAKEYFKKAINIAENNKEDKEILLESLLQLGNLYDDTGDKDMAIKTYEKGLTYDADNTSILCEMAVAYKISGDKEKAKALLNKVLSIDKNNQRAQEILKDLI